MRFRRRSCSTAIAMVALGIVTATGVWAAGLPPAPSTGQQSTGPPSTTTTSPSFTLEVRATNGRSARSSCAGARTVLGVGANLVLHGELTPLESDCHACCAENQIFSDGFESGGTTNWSGTIGG